MAPSSSAELVIDAAGFVPFGADDMKPASTNDRIVLSPCLCHEMLKNSFPFTPRHAVETLVEEIHKIRVVDDVGFAVGEPLGDLFGKGFGVSPCVSGLPPSRMSVPRPAMFVAIVTAPCRPAWATISASCS